MSFYVGKVNCDAFKSSFTINQQYSQPCTLGELFQCILCDYQTARKSNLKEHFMIHTKEKPFKCNDCNFSAATKSTLMLHVRTHTGEKPYECAICQRAFARRNIIKAHIKTHTNDKPFKCTECSFVTSRKDNLKFHMRRHLIDKPFKCQLCTSSFVQKCRFKKHLELHTKIFICFLCCYKTHSETNLAKHKLSHLKTNLFICFLCGKGFCKKYGVQVHITKIHHKHEFCKKNGNEASAPGSLCINYYNDRTINTDISYFNKTYIDKAIATDDFNDNLQLFPQLSDVYLNTEPLSSNEISANSPQLSNIELNVHQHEFMSSKKNCDIRSNCRSKPYYVNTSPKSNLRNMGLHSNSQAFSTETIHNFNDVILNNPEYLYLNYDSSLGSSSSDSETDSVKSTCNTNIQENAIEQNAFQNIAIINPELVLNYQPNVNYIVGLNVMQPVVIPTISLPQSSPFVLTSGFNNPQLSQDVNFVPICTNTNVFINNLVPNVSGTSLMLNVNPTFS